jgi:hypothetical protein
MTRSWMRFFTASSFVGAALVLGCHHNPRHCDCASGTMRAGAAVQPVTQKAVVVVNEAPIAKEITKAPPTPEPVAETTVEQASFVKPAPDDDHGNIRRRSFADISADPCLAHTPDYTGLTGELYYLKAQQCWTVRFASVDEEDRYGGSVTLTDLGTMAEFQSGQMVRVEGHMADLESHEPCPKFQVQSIHLVK